MRACVLLCLVAAWAPAARAQQAAALDQGEGETAQEQTPALRPDVVDSVGPEAPAPLEGVRRLLFEEAEFERAADELGALRAGAQGWSREQLATILELEAYVRFGLGEEDRWTQALLELATLDPGRALPSTFPLPLVRTLADLAANARSLVLTLDVHAEPERLELTAALLHDVGSLAQRLVVRSRRLGRAGEGWITHELADGRLVLEEAAGSELELEAIAVGPQGVELARSGVDLVSVPRRREVWEEWPFWTVLGAFAVVAAVVVPVAVWAATQPPELTLGMPSCVGAPPCAPAP